MTMQIDLLRRSFLLFLLAAGLVLPSMATVAQAAEKPLSSLLQASKMRSMTLRKPTRQRLATRSSTSYAASSALAKQIHERSPHKYLFLSGFGLDGLSATEEFDRKMRLKERCLATRLCW